MTRSNLSLGPIAACAPPIPVVRASEALEARNSRRESMIVPPAEFEDASAMRGEQSKNLRKQSRNQTARRQSPRQEIRASASQKRSCLLRGPRCLYVA